MAAASSARATKTVASGAKAKPAVKTKRTDEDPNTPVASGSAARSRNGPTKRSAGSQNSSRRAPTKRSLVQRVYNTIDSELTKLEQQKGLTSQDRERASRALSQMVNALEKAVEMQREMTKRKTTGGDARSKEALAHAEDLRREIAERLERLNRKRAAVRRPE